MKLPITKRRVRNHLTYAWWQYVLLVCLAVFGWNLIYTTTRYRSPEHLKVEWYGEGYVATEQQEQIDALLARGCMASCSRTWRRLPSRPSPMTIPTAICS